MTQLQQRLAGRMPGLLGATKGYSVLCPLVEVNPGEWGLLFEVRSASLRRQPGEVCFPGGRMEPEETPVETALRETWEELSIPPEDIEVLGQGDFIASVGGFLLHPVLGQVKSLSGLLPSKAEVAETFVVPLDFFRHTPPQWGRYTLEPKAADFPYDAIGYPQGYGFQGGEVRTPIWHYESHIIWGLTARMVGHVLDLVDVAEI